MANTPAIAQQHAACMRPLQCLDLAPFIAAPLRTDPYPHVIAHDVLQAQALPALRKSFPHIKQAGYLPVDDLHLDGLFARLIAELRGPQLAIAMTEKFGADFTTLPQLITVRGLSRAHEGRVHTDSESKIATLLVYMHHGWSSTEGRIRVLRSDSMDDVVTEVAPEEGNLFTFLRGPASWHGHTPFIGARRVVQVAWLRDTDALQRKRQRARVSILLKRLFVH